MSRRNEKKEKKKYKLEENGDDEDANEGREIKMTFTKKSKKINRPVIFNDDPTEMNVSIDTNESQGNDYMLKTPLDKDTQRAPIMSRDDCNSEMIKFSHHKH